MDSSFVGKKVHVIGLGAYGTGGAVARALAARGAQVTVSDIKPAEQLQQEMQQLEDYKVTIHVGEEAYAGIEKAELVVPSPGVPLDIPPLVRAREHGAKIISDIEVAFWIAPCPIIAVTGTKGKTTTTTLIGELLKDAGKSVLVGGNIGQPLVGLAETAKSEDILVAEVSSFQLETTESFRPRVAVLLNLFADHLDRHRDIAIYREAKAKIFANQEPSDYAVVNQDDTQAWTLSERTQAKVIGYSLQRPDPRGADIAEGWLRVMGKPICPTSAVRLRGQHNLGNVLPALATVHAIGVSLAKAVETLKNFTGIEHRLEEVGEVNGVLFVNDSQATTPMAAIAGLNAFDEKVVLIAGGRPKVHDFRALGEALARHTNPLVVIGEAAEEIAKAARKAGNVDVTHAQNLEEAVALAYERAQPQGIVLLSPACASFDMFENMAERGHKFKEAVRALIAREGSK